MSLWITPYVLPQEGCALSQSDFTTLILRVLHEGYGKLPVTVVTGPVAHPFLHNGEPIVYVGMYPVPRDCEVYPCTFPVPLYDRISGEPTDEHGHATLWYRGEDPDVFARTLTTIPYEREQVWVKFGDGDGPEFYALLNECLVGFWNGWNPDNEMHKKTQLLCELAGGLLHEDAVLTDPILPLLTEYFGEELRFAYTYA